MVVLLTALALASSGCSPNFAGLHVGDGGLRAPENDAEAASNADAGPRQQTPPDGGIEPPSDAGPEPGEPKATPLDLDCISAWTDEECATRQVRRVSNRGQGITSVAVAPLPDGRLALAHNLATGPDSGLMSLLLWNGEGHTLVHENIGDGDSDGNVIGVDQRLAVGPSGKLHWVYRERARDERHLIRYRSLDSTNVLSGAANIMRDVNDRGQIAIAVSGTGLVHVATHERSSGDFFLTQQQAPTEDNPLVWDTPIRISTDSEPRHDGHGSVDLALDSTGIGHVAMWFRASLVHSTPRYVTYRARDVTTPRTIDNFRLETTSGIETRVLPAGSDTYFVFLDWVDGISSLQLARYDIDDLVTAEPLIEHLAMPEMPYRFPLDAAMDEAGRIHIVVAIPGENTEAPLEMSLHYLFQREPGGSFVDEVIRQDFAELYDFASVDLALDGDGLPHIAYSGFDAFVYYATVREAVVPALEIPDSE